MPRVYDYSCYIEAVTGVVVVLSVLFFEKIKIDDPVGVVSVHGVNGAQRTLAAGVFNVVGTSASIIGVQLLGIFAAFFWSFGAAFILFKLAERAVGLRVSAEYERQGFDFAEHSGTAYPAFEVLSYSGTSVFSVK